VRKRRSCVEARKGMADIKLSCFRRLFPFFKRVQKRFPGFARESPIRKNTTFRTHKIQTPGNHQTKEYNIQNMAKV
jgi:hypothetical protein